MNVTFDLEEIKKHLETLESKKDKMEYLLQLRTKYYFACYNSSDKMIESYISSQEDLVKYERIPYSRNADIYQTHISRSEFILLLRHIDSILIPFVNNELIKLDNNVEDVKGIMNKDYKIFDFNLNKIFEHSNTLKDNKILYLEAVKIDYKQFLDKIVEENPFTNFNYDFFQDDFNRNLDERINALKRYPEVEFPNFVEIADEKVIEKVTPKIFIMEPTLFEFDIFRIKEHVKGINNSAGQIKYLEFVKKEAKQNSSYFDEFEYLSFIQTIDSEIDFYTKIFNMPQIKIDNNVNASPTLKENIKLHWQDDNSLVPYLFKLLLDEGFISGGDFADRKQFIEQSICKKNGEIFTAKEVASYESGMKVNKNGVPKKAEKVQRAISKLKAKSNELKEKPKKSQK